MSKENGSGHRSGPSLELALLDLPSAHPCHGCGQCCHYIATEIDNPSSFRDYDNLHWYLLHEDVCVYVDWEGDWFLEFRTTCRHLTPSRTCGIYEERPRICSEFSWDECEKSSDEPAWKYRFETYQELLDWLSKRRPKAYEKYTRARRKLVRKRREASGGASASPSPGA